MLIVIVIIGILAAALVPRLISVQSRARDTKRKTDLRQIYNANEIYFTDNGLYPLAGCTPNASCGVRSTDTQPWIPELSGILTSIPTDPLNISAIAPYATGGYAYMYGWIFNTPVHTYDLITQLENTSDPDRCEIKQWKRYADTSLWCNGTYSKYTYDMSPNVKNVP